MVHKEKKFTFFFGQREKNGQKQGHLRGTYMYTSSIRSTPGILICGCRFNRAGITFSKFGCSCFSFVGRPGLVVYRGKLLQMRFTKTYHSYGVTIGSSWLEVHRQTYGVTIGSSWLEVHRQTHCPNIGS